MVGAVGLRTYIWNNLWKSALLLAGFPALLAVLGFGLALLLASAQARGFGDGVREALRSLPWILGLSLLAAAAWFGIAWRFSDRLMDWASGAHPVTRKQEPRLWNALETLCIARGLPMPRLAVIESGARNAFAAGLRPGAASVTVTRGLMDALDDRELTAVLAHELTHIRNGDARLGLIAAVFAGIIGLVADMVLRGTGRVRYRSSPGRREGGGNAALALAGLALIALAWGLAVVLRMALSRNREFLADAGAVALTQDPDAMIGALRKVEGHSAMPEVPRQVRALFLDDEEGALGGALMATHPPIAQRIAALVRFAGGRDPGPLAPPEPPAAEPPW
ncbi:M48 family metallopeptidase, partial [Caldovatus aquaticus]|nr:M48 family metallopeptidase [Caldovatus aquaticus]